MLKIYNVYSPKYNIPLWVFKNEKWYVTGIDRYIEGNPFPGKRFTLHRKEIFARLIIRHKHPQAL